MSPFRIAALAVAAIVVVSCSDGGDPPSTTSATDAPTSTTEATTTITSAPPERDDDAQGAPADAVVSVTVQVGDGPENELVGVVAESRDPFEQFASCSGFRAALGTYVVLISTPGDDVASVSVATADPVDVAGIHDATVRVEPGGGAGEPEVAAGTVTIDEGLRAGSFTAFTAAGDEVSGSFRCEGGADSVPGDASGDEQIEVFALLRRGGAQRLVDMIAPLDETAECIDPAADAPTVAVEGDATTGAITAFALSPEGSMSMRVGTADFEFPDVEVGGVGDARTFSAVAGDVSVDGAFRCG